MKIIARAGVSRYLVETEGMNGFVANIDDKLRFPEQAVAAIVKFGYWREAPNNLKLLEEIKTYQLLDTDMS